jgi:membrane fusion protein (multidrug efflux system)
VSRQEYDNAAAALLAAAADVAAAKAAVQVANINLDYSRVLAPISGHIGRSEVTEGAYVQQGQATLLATVQQIDQVYVDVNQSSSEVLRLKKDFASGRLKTAGSGEASVKILLDDGTEYPLAGVLKFADVTVNTSTGTVAIRALFPNPDRVLLPGLFVRTRLDEGVNPAAILVPQQGVGRNQRGEATALVVGAEDKVELRVLATDRAIGNQWLVTSGVKAGDRVIVQNLQKVRPGAVVKPVPATNISTPKATASAQ